MQVVPVTTDPAVRLPLPRRVKSESKNAGAKDGDAEDDYEYGREEGGTVGTEEREAED